MSCLICESSWNTCLGMEEEPTERLWVKINEMTGKDNIIVGICYRLPDQEKQVDEALYSHLEAYLGPHGEVQPPQYLLGSQHSKA